MKQIFSHQWNVDTLSPKYFNLKEFEETEIEKLLSDPHMPFSPKVGHKI
jgi:hypothetical protein